MSVNDAETLTHKLQSLLNELEKDGNMYTLTLSKHGDNQKITVGNVESRHGLKWQVVMNLTNINHPYEQLNGIYENFNDIKHKIAELRRKCFRQLKWRTMNELYQWQCPNCQHWQGSYQEYCGDNHGSCNYHLHETIWDDVTIYGQEICFAPYMDVSTVLGKIRAVTSSKPNL